MVEVLGWDLKFRVKENVSQKIWFQYKRTEHIFHYRINNHKEISSVCLQLSRKSQSETFPRQTLFLKRRHGSNSEQQAGPVSVSVSRCHSHCHSAQRWVWDTCRGFVLSEKSRQLHLWSIVSIKCRLSNNNILLFWGFIYLNFPWTRRPHHRGSSRKFTSDFFPILRKFPPMVNGIIFRCPMGVSCFEFWIL